MNKEKNPSISYEAEADVVRIELSKKDISHAKEVGSIVVHMNKDNTPVYLEILDATRFLKIVKGLLPKEKIHEVMETVGAAS